MLRQINKLKSELRIAHGFFGRDGGVSEGIYSSLNCGPGSRDDATAVIENRRRVMSRLGANELITLSQVHSSKAVVVPAKDEISQADAMVTNQPNIALGILTADCGPVLFADTKAGVIGAAHAGWKGAIGGVIENTIAAMEGLGATRENIIAALGPTIARTSYEVGEAFQSPFLQQDSDNSRFFSKDNYFDLPAYILHRLAQSDVTNAEDIAIDTYSNDADYFSYRRTTHNGEADYGRQISAIMLK